MTLPSAFRPTRDSLHALACYSIAPARKARTGRIGLRPTGDGIGTPPFDDGIADRRARRSIGQSRRGKEIDDHDGAGGGRVPGRPVAAPTPASGSDLPPFEPDAALDVDVDVVARARVLVLDRAAGPRRARRAHRPTWRRDLRGAALARALRPRRHGRAARMEARSTSASRPVTAFETDPYVYVGPQDMTGVEGDYWNAPFGAYLPYAALDRQDPAASALAFIETGIASL